MIPHVQLDGKFFRDVDRLMGRLPALDKAIQRRMPSALGEVGEIMVRRARAEAPVRSGNLRGETDFEVRGDELAFGVWGVPYSYPTEYGVNSRAIISEHERMQTVIFGQKVEPFEVEVRQHVRDRKIKARQYLHPAYYSSFSAMFGILNRTIEDAKEETGLGGD